MHSFAHYQHLVTKCLKENWTISIPFQYFISMLYLFDAQLKIVEEESTQSNDLNYRISNGIGSKKFDS